MTIPPVKTAVFPVGGLGTRFLPATKSMPKEMLPIVDKPLVHYAFEEARAAGIERFIFITGRNKDAINNHFDYAYELESTLDAKNKSEELAITRDWLPEPGCVSFIRQQEPMGLGHAIWCARYAVGNEPFAVLLPDDMVLSDTPCLRQMLDVYQETGGNLVAVADVPHEHTSRYGILDVSEDDGTRLKAKGLVEKPKPEDAPSTASIFGRYILQPEIFSYLEKQERGAGGEIQITDAIAATIGSMPFHGVRFNGTRYDCGNKVGFLAANIAFALQRDDMKDSVTDLLRSFASSL